MKDFEPKMTVGELIQILLEFPQDMPVAVNWYVIVSSNDKPFQHNTDSYW